MGSERPEVYDEDRRGDGSPRPGYGELLAALSGVDLDALMARVSARLDTDGVTFDERTFAVDPIPRLITAEEWEPLRRGLAQRSRALNRFLQDAYGPRRIVRDGVVPAATIELAEGIEPDLEGRLPPGPWPAAIIGFDVVRDAQGEFLVLEDNVRTPSGFTYALAAREALLAELPPGCPAPEPVAETTFALLRATITAAVPAGVSEPVLAVITDGPSNVAYYEHARAAEALGALLLTPDELELRGGRLVSCSPGSRVRAIDVVYRRTDEDRIREDDGSMTQVAARLLPPWLGGKLGLVNAFGNGVADDKLVQSHVEEMIRFYLGEEPIVRSVPTREVADHLEDTIARLAELVVKPRHGHGGAGVVIGPHARAEDLRLLAGELQTRPERYISQPTVQLSRHPTVIGGRLQPRHVDLRPFAFAGSHGVGLMPGGLSRVAFDEGALVVNSSQNGGGKDTWILSG